MENTTSIGQRIKYVRDTAELSQKEFGRRVGLSQTAITALENNQTEPRLSTFYGIVDAFKVSPEWLRTGAGTAPETVSRGYTIHTRDVEGNLTGSSDPEENRRIQASTPGPTSAAATVEYANWLATKEAMREVIAAKDKLIGYLEEELKKFGGSSDAASAWPYTRQPTGGQYVLARPY